MHIKFKYVELDFMSLSELRCCEGEDFKVLFEIFQSPKVDILSSQTVLDGLCPLWSLLEVEAQLSEFGLIISHTFL